MNSICLSVAPNLRCQGLSKLEHIVLIVPPAIELVYSFTLAISGASLDGRKRCLLVLDGLSFFLLALTDFLAQVIPEAAATRRVFALLDTIVAAASLLPILFYTLFLFLFARASLVTYLPTRFSRIATLSLLAIIPPILVSNELGSLLGLTHTVFSIPNHTPIVATGSSTPVLQRLSQFFSAITLALLTVFQALLFVLAFVRVVRGFLDERRIETSKHDPHAHEEIHLFRGLGWFAGGLKLGMIETVVGFANTSFAVVVARRILRLFARGTLIIGVIKGLNLVEDFHVVESDLRARSRSTRRLTRISRLMISNPRNSTFRELSPNASGFHKSQRTKRIRVGPSPLALGGASNHAAFESKSNLIAWNSPGFDATSLEVNAIDVPRAADTKKERVTIQYNGKTPPVLQLRFSRVDMNMHPLPPSMPNTSNGHTSGHSHHHAAEKSPLPAVVEDSREDNASVSLSLSDRDRDWDRQLFYPGYIPRTAPAPSTPRAPAPRRPMRDPRRASLTRAEPSLSTDVPMPARDTTQKQEQVLPRSTRDSLRRSPVRSSSLAQYTRPSQDIPKASQETQDVRLGLGVTTRSTRTMSAASDSLEIVREIAARFPRLPPRVVPGNPSSGLRHTNTLSGSGAGDTYAPPPGLPDDADADSDSEWRTLARARSLQRRREREREAGAVPDISPVNSIKRKPAPSSSDERVDMANAGGEVHKGQVTQAIIARAAHTARAARSAHGHGCTPSLDASSVYSSDDDGSDGGKYSYTARHTPELTPALGTPATTAAVATPGLGTPIGWAREDQRSTRGVPGRVMVVEGANDLTYSNVQMQPYTQRRLKQQSKQLPPSLPREEAVDARRRHRLTLLRRELPASAHDSAAASATLDLELQAPWLHADPLTQLQTIGTGTLHVNGEDEDAVLDEAWRRAGLTRIKSVSHVRVHTTPRAEQGIETRESLVAEEEEDLGLLVTPVEIQEQHRERRASVSLRKPARLDSGVLGEEDRRLVRQGIRA